MNDDQAWELLDSANILDVNEEDVEDEEVAEEVAIEEAIKIYDKIIKTSSNSKCIETAKEILVEYYYSSGNYNKAIEIAKENLEFYHHFNCKYILELLGMCYYEKNEYQTALEYFSKALEIWKNEKEKELVENESEIVLYKWFAKCYFELKFYAQAVKYMKEAVTLNTSESYSYNPYNSKNEELLKQMEEKLEEASEVKRTNFGRKVDF